MSTRAGPKGTALSSVAAGDTDIGARQAEPHAFRSRLGPGFLARLERTYSELVAVLDHSHIMPSADAAYAYHSFH